MHGRLSIGYSPCPNDTFIFDALVHQKIDTQGLTFDVHLHDVEELNQKAFRGELDITKLSYHAFVYGMSNYVLLDAGSALGNNCGPLLIANKALSDPEQQVPNLTIAIPGKYTTANFLLQYAFPGVRSRREMLFSDIEGAILEGQVEAGVIIHENRFTYADKGLIKIMDLGEHWEQTTGLPIPLGGIAVKRDLPLSLQQKINRLMRKSVQYALDHPEASTAYVRTHAQEMDQQVINRHIELYVNAYTLDLGPKGKAAVNTLVETISPGNKSPLFVD